MVKRRATAAADIYLNVTSTLLFLLGLAIARYFDSLRKERMETRGLRICARTDTHFLCLHITSVPVMCTGTFMCGFFLCPRSKIRTTPFHALSAFRKERMTGCREIELGSLTVTIDIYFFLSLLLYKEERKNRFRLHVPSTNTSR